MDLQKVHRTALRWFRKKSAYISDEHLVGCLVIESWGVCHEN